MAKPVRTRVKSSCNAFGHERPPLKLLLRPHHYALSPQGMNLPIGLTNTFFEEKTPAMFGTRFTGQRHWCKKDLCRQLPGL
jgi:hypothetical protein